ncbi:MAG: YihY/virulence factor BrkB family protein [Planctomycetota bacterium]|nr:YihY/virulence factor BrkB family protein [Planctomycetota bacterium]
MSHDKSNEGNQKHPSFLRAVKQTASDWVSDNAMRLSAALALYAILSIAPLLVITIKVVGLIWRNKEQAREHMMAQMTSLMGSQAATGLQPMLDRGSMPGSGVLASVISSAILIFSATGVFVELQDSMNTIWHVQPKRSSGVASFVRNRLISVGMVFGIAFLLLISMFVSTLLASLAKYIAGDAKWLVFLVDVVVSFSVVSLLFGAIFKFLPDIRVPWRDVWHGALMTGFLFTVGKYALALYFKYGAPTSAFGAAGSLVAVLLWVYYSSFILFFGAEFTKVWSHTRTGALRRVATQSSP